MGQEPPINPLGRYASYQDLARMEYGRLLWKNPGTRDRLLRHWTSASHPHRERFVAKRALVEEMLCSPLDYPSLDLKLRAQGESLRSAAREIPPVFGSI